MWWTYIVGILVIALVIYAFVAIARGRTRSLTRKTDLTAEDLYDRYSDDPPAPHPGKSSGPGDGLLGGPAPPRR
jgi:hypothetical protein